MADTNHAFTEVDALPAQPKQFHRSKPTERCRCQNRHVRSQPHASVVAIKWRARPAARALASCAARFRPLSFRRWLVAWWQHVGAVGITHERASMRPSHEAESRPALCDVASAPKAFLYRAVHVVAHRRGSTPRSFASCCSIAAASAFMRSTQPSRSDDPPPRESCERRGPSRRTGDHVSDGVVPRAHARARETKIPTPSARMNAPGLEEPRQARGQSLPSLSQANVTERRRPLDRAMRRCKT